MSDFAAKSARSLGILATLAFAFSVMTGTTVRGQLSTNASPEVVDAYCRAAWELMQQAEDSNSPPDESRANLRLAIAQCDDALQIKPDYFRAAALAAHLSYRLGQLETNAPEHNDLFQSARARFAAAACCSGADATLFREWGAMLLLESSTLASPRARSDLLRDARRVYENGLETADFSGERAKLQRDLGTCLVLIASQTPTAAARLNLYEGAIRLFRATTNIESVANSPELCARWGIALVETAKLTRDFVLLRQAIERLVTALESDPKNLEARYNLVCAYALLDQPDNAMRHLRVCLENDDARRTYYNLAAHDPDLDSLRRTRDYNDIFTEAPVQLLPVPRLSSD